MTNKKYSIYISLIPIALAVIALLGACASMGTPSGGPRDEDPPILLRSNPGEGQLNFHGRQALLTFNELVNVKEALSRVTVSPPSKEFPKVITSGRNVIVQFPDTLRSATTYTIDFTGAIEDNNEGNPLGNLALTFSTGDILDSLRISGMVLDAATLEPQQYMLVGAHKASAPDSALATLRFERITRTDELGRFTLRGLKSVPYNVFALGDVNNDMRRDSPAELLAFYPQSVTPWSEPGVTTDTLYNMLTGKVDTIVEREYTRFLPNNLLLSVFDEGYKPQYLVKYERPDSMRIRLEFNAPSDSLPHLSFVGFDDVPAMRTEYTPGLDTITYWLSDPRLSSTDTLRIGLGYRLTSPQRQLVGRTDTLALTKPKVRKPAKRGKLTARQQEADSIARVKEQFLDVGVKPQGRLEIYDNLTLEWSEPISRVDTSGLRVLMQRDSLWLPVEGISFKELPGSASRRYGVDFPKTFGASYRLEIDSLAFMSMYGRPNMSLRTDFTVKKKEDYSALTLRLRPDTVRGFVEVLDGSDNPVARSVVEDGVARFPYLAPAEYYARFVADRDSDMRFTPGNYDLRLQPEEVYYYPGVLNTKRHDRSEVWDLNATPVDRQKPERLRKNKPQSRKPKRRAESGTEREEEDDELPFDLH